MIVLGIDPGTAMTGYGVVLKEGSKLRALDHGCIQTAPDRELPARLLIIHQALTELIEVHRPDAVGVERLFFNKNVQTAFAVGQARGVGLLAAAQHGLPVYEYGPHEVKIAVTGYGRAPKEQVQRMVQAILGLAELPRPDDAADALAVAVCLAHGYRPAA
ncbi:MAG: crossover junction endodeoxyribonuclease RuvC [Chloroflexi bacterium]|nr:crossover junction endodeoxyribonuclease RuvC [Chloroflexota bacterium]